MGFKACAPDTCVYAHEERQILAVTHVGDFLILGTKDMLEWVYQ